MKFIQSTALQENGHIVMTYIVLLRTVAIKVEYETELIIENLRNRC